VSIPALILGVTKPPIRAVIQVRLAAFSDPDSAADPSAVAIPARWG
jgi:hypothetical protein